LPGKIAKIFPYVKIPQLIRCGIFVIMGDPALRESGKAGRRAFGSC
jgi:hypothetical protein